MCISDMKFKENVQEEPFPKPNEAAYKISIFQ